MNKNKRKFISGARNLVYFYYQHNVYLDVIYTAERIDFYTFIAQFPKIKWGTSP